MLKSYGWVGWVGWGVVGWVAPKIIESAPVPFGPLWALLGLELGWTGLGLGLGGLGTRAWQFLKNHYHRLDYLLSMYACPLLTCHQLHNSHSQKPTRKIFWDWLIFYIFPTTANSYSQPTKKKWFFLPSQFSKLNRKESQNKNISSLSIPLAPT